MSDSRFVLRFNTRGVISYLRTYENDGLKFTFRLDKAKLFRTALLVERCVRLFGGEMARVVISGQEVRLALTPRRDVPAPISEPRVTHYRRERVLESEIERSF